MSQDAFEDDNTSAPFDRPGALLEPFLLTDVACIGLRWVANVVACAGEMVETTAGAINAVSNCVGMHANYQRRERQWARSVGATIERL